MGFIVTWRQDTAAGFSYHWTMHATLADARRHYEMLAAPYSGGPIQYAWVRLAKVMDEQVQK